RDRLIVFGGYDGAQSLNDVWGLNLSGVPDWELLSAAGGPSPRNGLSAIYDPVRDRMVLFGGVDNTRFSDTWALEFSGTPSWSQLFASGSPGLHAAHSAIYDPIGDRMIVVGGD